MTTEYEAKAFSGGDQDSTELDKMKKALEHYRVILVPLNKFIEWDQSYYPAILVGVTTLIFSIVWYLEPSVLTTACILGLIFCIVDFAMPTISPQLEKTNEWTERKSVQYEQICIRLCNAKRHISNTIKYLADLKTNKPNAYLILTVTTFGMLAWFGCLIDNLLLVYIIVVAAVLVPGLRKHGIMQKVVATVKDKIASARGGNQAAKSAGRAKVN